MNSTPAGPPPQGGKQRRQENCKIGWKREGVKRRSGRPRIRGARAWPAWRCISPGNGLREPNWLGSGL